MKKIYSLFIAITISAKLFATDYYVKPTGNDGGTGTSVANAWQSMAKVANFAWVTGFVAGDKILFEGGQTFVNPAGIYLQLDKNKGTAANPITFTSYGVGRAILKSNANSLFNLWAPISGNVGLGFKFTNLILEGDGVTKTGPTQTHGIVVYNGSATVLDYLLVEDVDISGFAGNGFTCGRDGKLKGRLTNIMLKKVVSHNNPGAINFNGNTGSGIVMGGADGALIEDCIAFKNGINNNNAAGPVGIWMWDCVNSVIQKCESHHNETTYGDGAGFDIDGACQNCMIQYCYSHNNQGAGYLLAQFEGAHILGPLQNNTIRYNISENDGRKSSFGGIHFWANGGLDVVGATEIYNNTIYMGGEVYNGVPAAITFQNTNCTGIKIHNNIFVTANNYPLISSPAGTLNTAKVQFLNNNYWTIPNTPFNVRWGATNYNSFALWQNATGQEKINTTNFGFTIDPQLQNPGNGATINNTTLLPTLTAYKLKPTSGLINKGLNLTQPPYNIAVGSRDFFGTNIPNTGAYDLGAYEHISTLPVSLINFGGRATTVGNVLAWRTTAEQNNRGFEILRSKNGSDFVTIGFEKTQAINGNSTATLEYSFNDNNILDDAFYQLKQIDFDGNTTPSNIIVLKAGFIVENKIYPNPVSNDLNMVFTANQTSKVIITVSNLVGKIEISKQDVINKGNNHLKLNTHKLIPGWYIISVKNMWGTEILTRKIIKN